MYSGERVRVMAGEISRVSLGVEGGRGGSFGRRRLETWERYRQWMGECAFCKDTGMSE
jgi:hypothetical protein